MGTRNVSQIGTRNASQIGEQDTTINNTVSNQLPQGPIQTIDMKAEIISVCAAMFQNI